LNMMS